MTTGTTRLSATQHFWLQLARLCAGIGTLALAHSITQPMNDSTTGATLPTVIALLVVIPLALAAVGRSTYVIVTSGHSDAYRIFRSRHLFATGVVLSIVAAATTASMIVHDAFGKLFAHGRITGEDMVDLGIMAAALICTVGAGAAFTGSWDRRHAERHWHRSLHLDGRRQT